MALNLTTVGSPTFGTGASGFGQDTTSFTDSDYFTAASNPASALTAFSISMRVRMPVSPANNLGISLCFGANFWVGVNGSGVSGPAMFSGVSNYFVPGSPVNDNTWHTMLWTVDFTAGSAQMYLDGTRVFNTTGASLGTMPSTVMTLGKLVGLANSYWRGEIDEVAIFSGVWQTGATYTPNSAPFTGSESNLLALWHLDGNGTDSSGGPPPAATYTMTGPTLGAAGSASSNFTLTPDGVYTGNITPSDGAGGTITPAPVNWAGVSSAKTFTENASSGGVKSISATSSPGLTNPAVLPYVAVTPVPSFTGPIKMIVAGDSRCGFYGTQLGAELALQFPNASSTTTQILSASGTGTAQWLPTNTTTEGTPGDINTNSYNTTRLAAVAMGCRLMTLDLGTNDAGTATNMPAGDISTPNTWAYNMNIIIQGWFASIPTLRKLVLIEQAWCVPGSFGNAWTSASDTLLQAYVAAMPGIVAANPGCVIAAPGLFAYTQANPSILTDGIHMQTTIGQQITTYFNNVVLATAIPAAAAPSVSHVTFTLLGVG